MKNNFSTLISAILSKVSSLHPKKNDVYTKKEAASKKDLKALTYKNVGAAPSKHNHSYIGLNDKPCGEAVVPRLYVTEEDLEDYYLYNNYRRISDTVYDIDSLNGVKVTYVNQQGNLVNGSVGTGELKLRYMHEYDEVQVVAVSDGIIVANVGTNGICEPGLWLNHNPYPDFKIISFEVPQTIVVTKLDEKYIPESIARISDIPNVADVPTMEEILEALPKWEGGSY